MNSKPLIYLAGPDVFYPDAKERYAYLAALCIKHGMQAVSPVDGEANINMPATPKDLAARIYQDNLDRIRQCDAILANLVNFRGDFEPDSGTVFEVGFGIALHKIVVGYTPTANEDMRSKIIKKLGDQGIKKDPENGYEYDPQYGCMIEDFGLPLNLMLSVPIPTYSSLEEAVEHIASII